jgi:hypothetical protein
MEWTADEIALLRKLAHKTPAMTYVEMGSHLGRSKNSIARKAHDLDLPPRPASNSGFQADRGRRADHGRNGRSYVKKRAGKTTLPPLASLQDR